MRVLFLTLYPPLAASSRYRVHQFLPYLREAGFECDVWPAVTDAWYPRLTGPTRRYPAAFYHLFETPRRLMQLLDARLYDVVVVQKALLTAYVRGFGALARSRATRLVLDIDDAVHLEQPQPLRRPWSALTNGDQVSDLMRNADLVLAGNAWLAHEAEALGGNAALFPTVADTDRFSPVTAGPSVYRIGWIGGPSTTPALSVAADALERTPNAEVVLIGADPERNPIRRAEVKAWNLDAEVDEIRRFSVGIMPLAKSPWDRGKCALKALQYMACGIPCVATPFGAVLEIIEDGVNGLFADSPAEWTDALERLRDKRFRNEMGEAARAVVEQRFALKDAAPDLIGLLESIA